MSIVKTKQYVFLPGVLDVKIEIIVPDIYGNLHDVVGVYQPGFLYNPALRLSPNELRRNGVLMKLLVRTEAGTSHDILCAIQDLSSALPKLVGRTIPVQIGNEVIAKKITKASIPRRRNRL